MFQIDLVFDLSVLSTTLPKDPDTITHVIHFPTAQEMLKCLQVEEEFNSNPSIQNPSHTKEQLEQLIAGG